MRQVVIASLALALSSIQLFAQAAPAGQRPAAPRGGSAAAPAYTPAPKSPDAGEVIVFETVKGTFEIETYPKEAPKTVAHVLALVNRRFYNGLRVHRAVPGFLVQFGDPQTRDMTKREWWGRGFESGSGQPVGVLESSPKRTHVAGAVGLAHPGDPKQGDSQMYITVVPTPRLNGTFTVFGKLISGMDVVRRLAETDVIRRATVRAEAPAAR
jgi:peptidyl-prolyl cis-trans isomerase B (cyclophilin B)